MIGPTVPICLQFTTWAVNSVGVTFIVSRRWRMGATGLLDWLYLVTWGTRTPDHLADCRCQEETQRGHFDAIVHVGA